jgi:ferredoxin
MLDILIKSLKTGVITEPDPLGVPASFGFPVIDFSRCTACDECARACPTGAIHTAPAGADRKIVTLSYAACIQCRACVTQCPEQAVSVSHSVEVAAYTRQQLAHSASFDIDPVTGREIVIAFNTSNAPLEGNVEIDPRTHAFRSLHGNCNEPWAPGSLRVKLAPLDYVVCSAQETP